MHSSEELYDVYLPCPVFFSFWMRNAEQSSSEASACPQEVTQLAEIIPNETNVTSSNLLSPLLCGHVKKKKKK
jgi:hypothetical protein